ncbi:MAG: hypothetical protein RLZ25_2390 [Pseudomonadota bacterium]|jgi:hypothetical protein
MNLLMDRLMRPRILLMIVALIGMSGCGGYASSGGMGGYGMGGMGMGGLGMGPMGMAMGMGGYGMGNGAMGAGYLGTAYGTGGMEMGTNLGGWGEGTGDDWGHNQNAPGGKIMDNDPHMTSSYHNTDFDNDRGLSFYHPSQTSQASGPGNAP